VANGRFTTTNYCPAWSTVNAAQPSVVNFLKPVDSGGVSISLAVFVQVSADSVSSGRAVKRPMRRLNALVFQPSGNPSNPFPDKLAAASAKLA
jgi:hypothetical protein